MVVTLKDHARSVCYAFIKTHLSGPIFHRDRFCPGRFRPPKNGLRFGRKMEMGAREKSEKSTGEGEHVVPFGSPNITVGRYSS